MGGMVLETSMSEIITRIEEQNAMEKQEVSWKNNVLINQFLSHQQQPIDQLKFK